MLRGWCWELETSVLRTKGTEFGFSGKMLPTPVCHNAKELTASPSNLNRRTPGLGTLAAWGKLGTPGRLNPSWVEWLMGWPVGWTDLKPSEMGKFHSWLQSHSVILNTFSKKN
jgi:hypothetical protein